MILSIKKATSTKCRHYNGCINEKCKAEIVYKDVQHDASPGKPLRLPCFTLGMFSGPDLPCPSRSIPTEEEALSIAVEQCDKAYRHAYAVGKAKDDARLKGFKKGSGGRGEVPCIACNSGTIRYSVASLNGHMHARCTTNGCVSRME